MSLSIEERTYLEKIFHLRFRIESGSQPQPDSGGTPVTEGSRLQQEEGLEETISLFAKIREIDRLPIAASQFTKFYSRMLCGVLYAMSVYRIGLDASLPSLSVAWDKEQPFTLILAPEGTPDPETLASGGDRNTWRAHTLAALFTGNLQRLFCLLSGRYRLSPQMLWENAAVYVHHFYGEMIAGAAAGSARERITGDYRFLLSEEAAWLTGGTSFNPLGVEGRCIPHPAQPGVSFRVRKTCCLKYQLPDSGSCTTCPLITDEERSGKLTAGKPK
ncbi:(2Fe-2S)-binding protein [Paenibacillus sp. CC-CFT747]|nr:(2Fe-2S)-binding protein [Paenibacillus sp. CC-CFT747]